MLRTIAMTCYMGGARFANGVTLPWLNRWSLSACQARAVFPKNEGYKLILNTDAAGHELLIHRLKLPFDVIIPDDLAELPEGMGWLWSLPKISTYKRLCEMGLPFLHLDYDFKFWRKPTAEFLAAPAFAQYVTPCPANQRALLAKLPVRSGRASQTCNAGILGGNDIQTMLSAANAGMGMGLAPKNRPAMLAASKANDWLPGSLIEETAIADAFGERMVALLPADATHEQWDAAGCSHEANNKSDRGSICHNEFRLYTEHPAQWRRTRDAWISAAVPRLPKRPSGN